MSQLVTHGLNVLLSLVGMAGRSVQRIGCAMDALLFRQAPEQPTGQANGQSLRSHPIRIPVGEPRVRTEEWSGKAADTRQVVFTTTPRCRLYAELNKAAHLMVL